MHALLHRKLLERQLDWLIQSAGSCTTAMMAAAASGGFAVGTQLQYQHQEDSNQDVDIELLTFELVTNIFMYASGLCPHYVKSCLFNTPS
jgi:hypothetical protein